MLSAMAPHGREMSQDLRKKIIYFTQGEGHKKTSKALLISQNTVAKVVQTFKKDWNCNHLTETSRSSTEVNTFTFSHLADAFIQSDLQLGST